jgi:hypothetical protein
LYVLFFSFQLFLLKLLPLIMQLQAMDKHQPTGTIPGQCLRVLLSLRFICKEQVAVEARIVEMEEEREVMRAY